jgi:hypothetical protein
MEIERVKIAAAFLKDGQSFSIGDLRLGTENNTINVTGWSQYSNIESLTKSQALKELEEVKMLFYRMLDTSIELRKFSAGKSIEYNLYFDDYGKGSIIICSEKHGNFKWEMELK